MSMIDRQSILFLNLSQELFRHFKILIWPFSQTGSYIKIGRQQGVLRHYYGLLLMF